MDEKGMEGEGECQVYAAAANAMECATNTNDSNNAVERVDELLEDCIQSVRLMLVKEKCLAELGGGGEIPVMMEPSECPGNNKRRRSSQFSATISSMQHDPKTGKGTISYSKSSTSTPAKETMTLSQGMRRIPSMNRAVNGSLGADRGRSSKTARQTKESRGQRTGLTGAGKRTNDWPAPGKALLFDKMSRNSLDARRGHAAPCARPVDLPFAPCAGVAAQQLLKGKADAARRAIRKLDVKIKELKAAIKAEQPQAVRKVRRDILEIVEKCSVRMIAAFKDGPAAMREVDWNGMFKNVGEKLGRMDTTKAIPGSPFHRHMVWTAESNARLSRATKEERQETPAEAQFKSANAISKEARAVTELVGAATEMTKAAPSYKTVQALVKIADGQTAASMEGDSRVHGRTKVNEVIRGLQSGAQGKIPQTGLIGRYDNVNGQTVAGVWNWTAYEIELAPRQAVDSLSRRPRELDPSNLSDALYHLGHAVPAAGPMCSEHPLSDLYPARTRDLTGPHEISDDAPYHTDDSIRRVRVRYQHLIKGLLPLLQEARQNPSYLRDLGMSTRGAQAIQKLAGSWSGNSDDVCANPRKTGCNWSRPDRQGGVSNADSIREGVLPHNEATHAGLCDFTRDLTEMMGAGLADAVRDGTTNCVLIGDGLSAARWESLREHLLKGAVHRDLLVRKRSMDLLRKSDTFTHALGDWHTLQTYVEIDRNGSTDLTAECCKGIGSHAISCTVCCMALDLTCALVY